jgi:hypothetical protein
MYDLHVSLITTCNTTCALAGVTEEGHELCLLNTDLPSTVGDERTIEDLEGEDDEWKSGPEKNPVFCLISGFLYNVNSSSLVLVLLHIRMMRVSYIRIVISISIIVSIST